MVIMNMKIIEKHIKSNGILRKAWIKPAIGAIIMGVVVIGSKLLILGTLKSILGVYIGNLLAMVIIIYLGALVYINIMLCIDGIDKELLDKVPKKISILFGIKNKVIQNI